MTPSFLPLPSPFPHPSFFYHLLSYNYCYWPNYCTITITSPSVTILITTFATATACYHYYPFTTIIVPITIRITQAPCLVHVGECHVLFYLRVFPQSSLANQARDKEQLCDSLPCQAVVSISSRHLQCPFAAAHGSWVHIGVAGGHSSTTCGHDYKHSRKLVRIILSLDLLFYALLSYVTCLFLERRKTSNLRGNASCMSKRNIFRW